MNPVITRVALGDVLFDFLSYRFHLLSFYLLIDMIYVSDTDLNTFASKIVDANWMLKDCDKYFQAVSNLAIQFGESDTDGTALSRPFGVALLFAGFDPTHGAQLFHMDPSGTYVQYDAKAIGSGSEGAQQSLQVNILPHP